MYFYYPKERMKNCPEGFNLVPIVKVSDNPIQYKATMELTPFYDYERDVIQISNKDFINTGNTVEVVSYLLLHYEDSWLVIDDRLTKTTRIGLLPDVVNRGEEQRVYSSNFSLIRTGMETGSKPMVLLGFINLPDKVIFISRFDFQKMPSFITSEKKFRQVPKEELFQDKFQKENDLDEVSTMIFNYLKDTINSVRESK